MRARANRRVPLRAWAVLAILLVMWSSGWEVRSAHAADVHGDNGQDRYVGTGGLLLPRSIAAGPRSQVAGCSGCRWRLAGPCALELPGVAFPGQATCLSVARGCPGTAQLLRVWFDGGGGWTDLGLVCLGPGGPVTIARLSALARDSFAKDLPALAPRTAPARGILAQLPVVFDSGQPGAEFTASYRLLGEEVRVTARTRWSWEFGDGATLSTDDPGGPYPHLDVSHVYRRAGSVQARVHADWTATFSVDGLGPFAVPEPVTQDATSRIVVGEGRAVLAVH